VSSGPEWDPRTALCHQGQGDQGGDRQNSRPHGGAAEILETDGGGTHSGAVERAAHNEAQAKTWRMTSDAMQDLVRKAKEVLSHTGATKKTAPVASGSARRRRRASVRGDRRSGDADKHGSDSSTVKRGTHKSQSDDSDLELGIFPDCLTPPRSTSRAAAPSAKAATPATPANPATSATARSLRREGGDADGGVLPVPSARGGATGWSRRMSPS